MQRNVFACPDEPPRNCATLPFMNQYILLTNLRIQLGMLYATDVSHDLP